METKKEAQLRKKRKECMTYVWRYGEIGNKGASITWLKKALKFGPITEIQVWRAKRLLGDDIFDRIGIPEPCHQGDRVMDTLQKRMGGL